MADAEQLTEWEETKNPYGIPVKYAQFKATVAGVTREFTAHAYPGYGDKRAATDVIFTAWVGKSGKKLHPTGAWLELRENGNWVLNERTMVLNKHAFIAGWREDQEGTSQHTGSQVYYKK